MKSLLPLGLVLAVLGAGCALETLDSRQQSLAGGNYVAQGDSFASGTGTREYYDSGCQRSNHSYAKQLAAQEGMALSHVACSGARIPNVRANQLGALSAATDLVTISIGGNDAGFSSVITQCAKPWPFTCTGDINNARNYINNTLPGQLDALYTEIETRAPNAQVIVVGYLLTRLRDLRWRTPAAIALSAVIRGSYHLYQGFGAFIGNAVMGVIFASFYRRYGRVTPLIVAHSILDIVSFVGYALLRPYLHNWFPGLVP